MGNSSSSSSRRPLLGSTYPRPTAGSLASTGRYARLTTPSGGIVHVLGVYPCASRSEEEVQALIEAVRPAVVYVDVHPELLSVLEGDVRAGRTLLGVSPSAGSERAGAWRIPETTPSFRRYDDAGLLVSLNIRNFLADNEMLGLLGAEGYGPFKAAIKAAMEVRGGAAAGATASSSSAAAAATPAKLLAFPLPMQYNNGETLDRASHLGFMIVGNASTGSNVITTLIGNPNTWFFGGEEMEAAAAKAAAEAAAAAATAAAPAAAPGAAPSTAPAPLSSSSPPLTASGKKPDVEFTLALPDTGYFTRIGVSQVQERFRALANEACSKATAATHDVEQDLLARELHARERGDAPAADAFALRALTSQKHSAAVAFHIQTSVDEVAAMARGAGVDARIADSATSLLPPFAAGAVNPSAPVAVAVVNLGGMGSLQRNWTEAQPPQELFPPLSFAQTAVGYGLAGLGVGAGGWAVVKGVRRFPKITALVTTGIVGSGAAIVYSAVYGDWTRYGNYVRSGLARPRVTSPLARANK
jgi:hypothetical protein